ncbi:MAG TPA: sulfate transporter CysZ [Gammaproteobacteria bacterium]|nr:sulfate transporter CysZ [Gammaproteobacteria bacterium]
MKGLVFSHLLKGYRLLWQPGFKKYLFIPLALNIIIFLSLTTLSLYYTWHILSNFQFTLPSWLHWTQSWLPYLGTFLFWIGWIGSMLFILIAIVPVAILLTNLLASPFNSLLCEKILKDFGSTPIPPSSWRTVVKEAFLRELQKMLYFLPRMGVLFLLFAVCTFIPIINVLAAGLFYVCSSWLLSLEYLDYPGETLRFTFHEVKKHTTKKRWVRFHFGLSAMLFSTVPLLNLMCIPVCVAAASLVWIDSFESRKENHTVKR